jgi:hypothetical protein
MPGGSAGGVIVGLHAETPVTTLVVDEMVPLLLMLLELSQFVETVPKDRALIPALPVTPTALLLLESTVIPQCVAVICALLLIFSPMPVGCSRQMQVGAAWPPPATARAATVMPVREGLNAAISSVGICLDTMTST